MKADIFQTVAAVYHRRHASKRPAYTFGGHRPHLQKALDCILLLGLFVFMTAAPCLAAATLSQQIDPPEANVGDEVVVTFTVQNGSGVNIHLPQVEGLQSLGTSSATNISFTNGAFSSAYSEAFHLSPLHPGDFTIPAFDIHLQDGGTLRTQAIKLHVLSTGAAPPPANPSAAANPAANAQGIPGFNPNGPVVFPPNNAAPQAPPSAPDTTNPNNTVPMGTDGRPAKVFVVITPQTTEAYVGQSIPLKIEFYIRLDSAAQQDSLPTIKGSDFLMNNLSLHPREEELNVMNEGFHRESWYTAISAPKSGDFPLQMERDTYWVKSSDPGSDPFTNFFPSHPNLAHEMVPSNQLNIHVHVLPAEGKPANFSGAIGQFNVAGNAQPLSVAVGEPVTLRFSVNGGGNFDYVRCPTVSDDPAWKTYVPSSKTDYQDESHTQASKNFEMAVIPQKSGTLPLPPASFSYFDPSTKQYVTTPISLPAITVTGSATASVSPSGSPADSTAETAPAAAGFLPNRVDSGSPQFSLAPVYRDTWYWAIQGGLFFALVAAAFVLFFRSRSKPDDDRAARLQRLNTQAREEDAMGEAVRREDGATFFMAARHAVQLKLGTQWRVNPESLTLAEIRQRDPELALSLEPLFLQADEIIYSGGTVKDLDLAQWERYVRELLQPQTQTA